jgi:hypothetical protein
MNDPPRRSPLPWPPSPSRNLPDSDGTRPRSRSPPVDARAEDGLHRGRNLDGVERAGEAIDAALAHDHFVSTSARTLSSGKKGLPAVRVARRGLRRRHGGRRTTFPVAQ